jgi:meso-butanediol dehydrogenase/(S,S)-butanediol dehydrogenase/diacetyl reductase
MFFSMCEFSLIEILRRKSSSVSSAAVFEYGNIEDVSTKNWSRVFDVNVHGCASMVKYIVPIFKKQNSGSIVNITSTMGVIAIPNSCPYSASKAAVIQLTRNLALDLGAFNIRVNSISPSLINVSSIDEHAKKMGLTGEQLKTVCMSMTCLKRNGEPEEIANLVVFLASDLCQFMTGANLVVDGGGSII